MENLNVGFALCGSFCTIAQSVEQMKKLKEKLSMLNSSINKIVLTLCLLMIACSSIHSQDTSKITITSDQLRTANLIFAEHKELSKMVPLLRKENHNLQLINNTWSRTDSIKSMQITQQRLQISEQCKDLSKTKKAMKISCSVAIVATIVTVLCLTLK